ncbi:hypothetical protein LPB41_15625 [Thalassospira sp. MA62]|nr:hypothetical protein [Thalassospira sp. MA62]
MIDQLIDRISDMAKAAAAKCAVFAIIALVMLIGVGFLLSAVYMAIAQSFGAIAAASAVGGTLIVLGLVALAIMMQRDPGASVEIPTEAETADQKRQKEDAVLMDLLMHAATAGYATGQGDKSRMQAGFDQIITDLTILGVFDPTGRSDDLNDHGAAPDRHQDRHDDDTKMAG